MSSGPLPPLPHPPLRPWRRAQDKMAQLQQTQAALDQLLNQLIGEQLLDEQFMQLLQLQDESNPDFVTEVVELYFEDSGSKLDKLGGKLVAPPVDFNDVDQLVHQFKGSSASFGAQSIAQGCVKLREACLASDLAACQALLQHIQQQFQVGCCPVRCLINTTHTSSGVYSHACMEDSQCCMGRRSSEVWCLVCQWCPRTFLMRYHACSPEALAACRGRTGRMHEKHP